VVFQQVLYPIWFDTTLFIVCTIDPILMGVAVQEKAILFTQQW